MARGFAAAALGLALAAGAAVAPTARAAGGEGGDPLAVRLGERLTLSPYALFQYDAGTTFDADRPGAPSAGGNPRRARLGVEAEAGEDWAFALIWDFGGTPGSRSRLYEASATYSGLGPVRLQGGVFKPQYSLEEMQSSSDTLFLERASVVGLASGLAAGSGRVAAEARAGGERWLAAAALTGGETGPGADSRRRGVTARVAGLPVRTDAGTALHLGLSGSAVLRAARDGRGRPEVSLSDDPELALDRRDPPLGTGAIRADRARTLGAEAGLGVGRLWAQGEYHAIAVDGPAGTLGFSGWYAQAAYVVAGRPRRWEASRAAWGAPGASDDAPLGAVEVGARYSEADLDDGEVRGGRQRVLTAGVGWWPTEALRLVAQVQRVEVDGGEGGDRRFGALALRLQAKL